MKRFIVLLAALTLLLGAGVAQQQNQTQQQQANTTIVVSNNSTSDTLIALGPAAELGTPVLQVEDSLSEDAITGLEQLQPENVVIIGGPEAVSQEIESELGDYADSIERLGGETAAETSVRVSEQYWPEGSDQATVVHANWGQTDAQNQLLSMIQQELETGQPILISEGDNVSETVVEDVGRLEVEQVTFYTTDPEIETSTLEDMAEQFEVRQLNQTEGETGNQTEPQMNETENQTQNQTGNQSANQTENETGPTG